MIDLGRQVRDLDGLSAGSSLAIPVVKPHQRILIGDVKVVAYQREPVRGVEIFGEDGRSEEHTSELQSLMRHLVCRLLLEKKNQQYSRLKIHIDHHIRQEI